MLDTKDNNQRKLYDEEVLDLAPKSYKNKAFSKVNKANVENKEITM
jgi:hypothetical protein